MDSPITSLQLGLLSQDQISQVELLTPISQCSFTHMSHSESSVNMCLFRKLLHVRFSSNSEGTMLFS